MDVNGYIMHIKQAMKIFQNDQKIVDIHCVDQASLAGAFGLYKSWKDLQDPDSAFLKFLKDACGVSTH